MKRQKLRKKGQMKSTKAALTQRYAVTPEMLIRELKLTPAIVAGIEKRFGVKFQWFPSAYAEMQRRKERKSRRIPQR